MRFLIFFVLVVVLAKRYPNNAGRRVPPRKDQRAAAHQANERPVELSAEEERAEITREWDELMHGYIAQDIMTFVIPARAEYEFYEIIDTAPGTIRGAWFLISGEARDIDFTIMDPLQGVLFDRKNKREAVFKVEAETQGVYVFKFKNNKVMQQHIITFTYNTGNSTDHLLKREDITPVEESLIEVQKGIQEFQVDHQFAQLRQETHYKTVASANKNVFWFSIVESIGVIGVTAWQIYYIKKLLDNRRVF